MTKNIFAILSGIFSFRSLEIDAVDALQSYESVPLHSLLLFPPIFIERLQKHHPLLQWLTFQTLPPFPSLPICHVSLHTLRWSVQALDKIITKLAFLSSPARFVGQRAGGLTDALHNPLVTIARGNDRNPLGPSNWKGRRMRRTIRNICPFS